MTTEAKVRISGYLQVLWDTGEKFEDQNTLVFIVIKEINFQSQFLKILDVQIPENPIFYPVLKQKF